MTTLGAENWTATSTTTWPAQWVAGKNDGTASVASTRGRLTPAGTGYRTIRRVMSGIGTSTAKRRTTGTFILSAITEQYIKISGREVVGNTGDYPNGYFIQVSPAAGSWVILAGYATGQYGDATAVTIPMVAGNVYGYTIDVEGYTTAARVWNITAGQTEPATFQSTWTDADAGTPTGVPALSQQSGASTNPYVEFGPLTVTDGASGVITGSVAFSGAGTLATTGTPKPTGTRAYTGAGSLTLTGAGKTSSTVALTGSGTLTTSGQPTATGTLTTSSNGTLSLTGSATIAGSVELSSTGTLETASTVTTTGQLQLSGTGSTTLAGTPRITGDMASLGAGTLTLAGSATTTAALNLTGSGSLTYSASGGASGALTLGGDGQLTFAGVVSIGGVLTLSSVGVLVGVGAPAVGSALTLTGAGSLNVSSKQTGAAHTYAATITGQTYTAHAAVSRPTATLTGHGWKGRITDA